MYELKEVVIEITQKCNLGCLHCGSACGYRAAGDELSIEEWKDVLKQLAEMEVKKIVFSGGEPTLKKGFEELLSCAKRFGIKVGFISNGLVLFSESLQKVMRESKPFAVGLSIDGLKETHNKIRGNKESWRGLMQNISLLQELEIQICAVTTLNKLNYREMPKLAGLLDLIEIDSWQLQLAMPSGRMHGQAGLLLSEDEFRAICLSVLSLRKQYSRLNIQAADCFGIAPEDSIRSFFWGGCSAGINSIGIDAVGNVMPCLSLQEGARCENVREKPLAEIWANSPGFDFNRKFEIDKVKGRCKDCNLLSRCRGGCNSQSFSYYGHFHSSPFCFTRSFQ